MTRVEDIRLDLVSVLDAARRLSDALAPLAEQAGELIVDESLYAVDGLRGQAVADVALIWLQAASFQAAQTVTSLSGARSMLERLAHRDEAGA